jgi:hypothetical protein
MNQQRLFTARSALAHAKARAAAKNLVGQTLATYLAPYQAAVEGKRVPSRRVKVTPKIQRLRKEVRRIQNALAQGRYRAEYLSSKVGLQNVQALRQGWDWEENANIDALQLTWLWIESFGLQGSSCS